MCVCLFTFSLIIVIDGSDGGGGDGGVERWRRWLRWLLRLLIRVFLLLVLGIKFADHLLPLPQQFSLIQLSLLVSDETIFRQFPLMSAFSYYGNC